MTRMAARVAPCGSWSSPITAELIVAGTVTLGQIVADDADLYWSEGRPSEGGRTVICRRRADGTIEDVLPAPFNARSRVHEYGGGAFTVHDGTVYFVHDGDGRIYRLVVGTTPEPLTTPGTRRFADLLLDVRRGRLLCVSEEHLEHGEPINTLVAIDVASGKLATLAAGADFYASATLSPDHERLAWLCWRHPDMPWDSTELWVASLDQVGLPRNARRVAGGSGESIFQPQFGPDGTLHFISDRSGWWNIYRLGDSGVEALAPREAEFGVPQWVFGMSTYAFTTPKRIVCAFSEQGRWRLGEIDLVACTLREIATPYTDVTSVCACEGAAWFVGGSSVSAPAIVRLHPASGVAEVVSTSSALTINPAYLSQPQMLAYPTGDGEMAHAMFYPPCNRDVGVPVGELSPLLVVSHGGPTSASTTTLNLRLQYWTSRGFGVLDVNYRGSSGFGRTYRRALDGRWGIADVEDCVRGAQYLVQQGRADPARLAIRGSSAGGFTTLCALTFHNVFAAGASYYGISDLEALAQDTHKFEARYLERLVGPYPAERNRYVERSPIHHVERLGRPMIFLQGLDDKVVPPSQAERMVEALRAKGIAVAYVSFAGEAHGFRRAENIRRALEAELSFYGQVFGFEPADRIEPVALARVVGQGLS